MFSTTWSLEMGQCSQMSFAMHSMSLEATDPMGDQGDLHLVHGYKYHQRDQTEGDGVGIPGSVASPGSRALVMHLFVWCKGNSDF